MGERAQKKDWWRQAESRMWEQADTTSRLQQSNEVLMLLPVAIVERERERERGGGGREERAIIRYRVDGKEAPHSLLFPQ